MYGTLASCSRYRQVRNPNDESFNMWEYHEAMRTVPPNTVSQIDQNRHGHSMSTGYVDGHVTQYPVTRNGLEKIIIARSPQQ